MSHHSGHASYRELAERLGRYPQSAPAGDLLFRILSILFTPEEAGLASRLPLRPFRASIAARIWKTTEAEARILLERLADRGLMLDLEHEGEMRYVLPPPMAGFFEFSLMRVRRDIDQGELSRLFYQYLNVEEDFIRELFVGGATQFGRVLAHEPAFSGEAASLVLDWERATEVILSARHLGVSLCYCRHKMSHLGRACEAPLNICMTLNLAADSLIRHGHARRIDIPEGIDILHQARDMNLIQCADNVAHGVNFICHCCSCCCDGLLAARRLSILEPMLTSGFLPRFEPSRCSGCGACCPVCPVEGISLGPGPSGPGPARAVVAEERCLGCGVCARNCPRGAIRLFHHERRMLTPVNTAHRIVQMAIERGTLQHLIFDNRESWSHRAMGTVLGALLRLGPVQRLLANRQLNSRFLATLFEQVEVGDLSR